MQVSNSSQSIGELLASGPSRPVSAVLDEIRGKIASFREEIEHLEAQAADLLAGEQAMEQPAAAAGEAAESSVIAPIYKWDTISAQDPVLGREVASMATEMESKLREELGASGIDANSLKIEYCESTGVLPGVRYWVNHMLRVETPGGQQEYFDVDLLQLSREPAVNSIHRLLEMDRGAVVS
jgi:hypothetical protein